MAKRSSTSVNETLKKQKLDVFADFWDDDLDSDLIDDCFERATQEVSNSNRNNASQLPSYSGFKQPNKSMVTSTQASQFNGKDQEQQLKELQNKYAEKEGEVCILRANLQSLKTTRQLEQEKIENEWKNKLSSTQKDNKSIRTELEFKNLEIVNLKQQINELSRCVNSESSQKLKVVENKTQPVNKEQVKEVRVYNYEIQINSEKYYPLRDVDFSSLFKPHLEEKHIIRNKFNLYKRTISCLQNQPSQEETESVPHTAQQEINLNTVYSELVHLIGLSEDEINSEMAQPAINKVICISLQLLMELHNYLKQLEDHIQVQDVQESDALYLQVSANAKYGDLDREGFSNDISDEVGIRSGKLLQFLSEIFPFSAHFQDFLLHDLRLNLDSSDFVQLFESRRKFWFLSLILDITSLLGKTRKERVSSEFLIGVVKLLSKIYEYGTFDQVRDLICEITKEILFLRPHVFVIFHIITLLEAASPTPIFIDCICCKPSDNVVNNAAKGVLFFNRESCRFPMFIMLLENTLPKIENENLLLDLSSNILNIIFNIFASNDPWLYPQEDKRCKCLCQLYKLGLDIIYKNLKMFLERFKPPIYKFFCKKSIKILSLLIFNSYELTQNYVTHAQFNDIVYTLNRFSSEIGLDENDVKSLEKLNIPEDVPEMPVEKFLELEL